MAQDVLLTSIDRTALKQLANAFAEATGYGAAAGSSRGNSSQQRLEETKTIEGNIRAVKEESEAHRKSRESLQKFKDALGTTFNKLGDIIRGDLVRGVLKEFTSGVESGAEAVNSLTGYINREISAYKDLGITVEELHKFNKISRAASINLGGFNEWTGKLIEGQQHYYARIGNLSKATEYQATMMEQLTHVGAEASDLYGMFGKRLGGINDDLLKLGVTYEESRKIFEDFSKDEDVRFRLRGALDKKQRRDILLEIQARVKHFKMLGMSTEQAEKAAKALEQLGGKKPLDRYKQAAKAQAALTAMGVEGASEIGDIIRKGNRATKEERDRLQEVFGQAQNIAAESAQGPMAQEFFVRGLIEKTGLEDMMGKGGVFSTKLDAGAKVSQEQLDAIRILGKDTLTLTKSAMITEKLLNALNNNPWIKGSWSLLKDIKDILKDWGAAFMSIFSGSLATIAATLSSIGVAAFGIWEAGKAILTGTSDIWNWINNFFPNFAKALSSGLGWLADKLITMLPSWVVGNEVQKNAQSRLDLAERQAQRDKEAAKMQDKSSKDQEELHQSQMNSSKSIDTLVNKLGGTPGTAPTFGGLSSSNEDILEEIKKTNLILAKMAGIDENMASGLGREAASVSNYNM